MKAKAKITTATVSIVMLMEMPKIGPTGSIPLLLLWRGVIYAARHEVPTYTNSDEFAWAGENAFPLDP